MLLTQLLLLLHGLHTLLQGAGKKGKNGRDAPAILGTFNLY